MPDKVFCPIVGVVGVCRQVEKKLVDSKRTEVTVTTCGFYSEGAGKCSVGLLADGLKSLMVQADRIANAAEAIYAVLDPEDDGVG